MTVTPKLQWSLTENMTSCGLDILWVHMISWTDKIHNSSKHDQLCTSMYSMVSVQVILHLQLWLYPGLAVSRASA